MPVRVLVADDQKVVRDGLSLLLGMLPGVEVIGTAVDGIDAVRQAAARAPDVVLMDLSMPNCDGVEATRLIAGRQPDVRVVVLTAFADDDSVFAALRAGARGYLTKNAGAGEILIQVLGAPVNVPPSYSSGYSPKFHTLPWSSWAKKASSCSCSLPSRKSRSQATTVRTPSTTLETSVTVKVTLCGLDSPSCTILPW
jgi:CheY-like chemotaxis protein